MTSSITVQYDLCYDDYDGPWAAIAEMIGAFKADVAKVDMSQGEASNGWPIVEMTFTSMEAARKATASYLGIYDINDPEVDEFLNY